MSCQDTDARELASGRYLATATVSRDRVIAYVGGRGEQEIVIDPAWLAASSCKRYLNAST